MNKIIFSVTVVALCVLLGGSKSSARDNMVPMTAIGKPAEGPIEPFRGEPFLQQHVVFNGDGPIREPSLAVAVDGTILILRNRANEPEKFGAGHLRRSEDGGKSWGEIIEVPFGYMDSNFTPDENTGDIFVVRLWDASDRLWRSSDHGKTWREEKITVKPNEVMKWLEQTRLKTRTTPEGRAADSREYYLHGSGADSGITLRHSGHRGRLLVPVTFRPLAVKHSSDRDLEDAITTAAIYSDDRGATWQVSGLFPEGYTEEAGLTELHDGRVYYNSRYHSGFYDKSLARELRPDEALRREAWSHDGGQTWEGLRVNKVLPDGGGFGRGYGNKGGLVRLPVKDRDILIYSNTDTAGGDREKMTVWVSFDGGETWPVKRLVYAGPSAYSSLGAGRPGTPSEGMIYLLFEGGPNHPYSAIEGERTGGIGSGEYGSADPYSAMHVAHFNLSWILEGERTGNGKVPNWTQ